MRAHPESSGAKKKLEKLIGAELRQNVGREPLGPVEVYHRHWDCSAVMSPQVTSSPWIARWWIPTTLKVTPVQTSFHDNHKNLCLPYKSQLSSIKNI